MSKKHPHMGDSNTGSETEHVHAHGFGMPGDAVVTGLTAEAPKKRTTYSVVERQKVALRVVESTIRQIEKYGADARTVLISLAQHFNENPQPVVGPAGPAPKAPDLE